MPQRVWAKDLELQHEDLNVLGALTTASEHEQVDDSAEHFARKPHSEILAARPRPDEPAGQ